MGKKRKKRKNENNILKTYLKNNHKIIIQKCQQLFYKSANSKGGKAI